MWISRICNHVAITLVMSPRILCLWMHGSLIDSPVELVLDLHDDCGVRKELQVCMCVCVGGVCVEGRLGDDAPCVLKMK